MNPQPNPSDSPAEPAPARGWRRARSWALPALLSVFLLAYAAAADRIGDHGSAFVAALLGVAFAALGIDSYFGASDAVRRRRLASIAATNRLAAAMEAALVASTALRREAREARAVANPTDPYADAPKGKLCPCCGDHVYAHRKDGCDHNTFIDGRYHTCDCTVPYGIVPIFPIPAQPQPSNPQWWDVPERKPAQGEVTP